LPSELELMENYVRRGQPGSVVDRLSIILASIVLMALLAIPVKVLLGKANVFEDNRAYLLISNRPRSYDTNLEELAFKNSRLGYFRGDSAFGEAVSKRLPENLKHQQLVMLRAQDYGWSTSDLKAIESRLHLMQQPAQDLTFLPFLIAAGIGLLLGMTFAAPLAKMSPGVFGALALISVYKYSHACPTCPIVTFLGIDAALVGVAVFAAMFFLSIATPAKAVSVTPLVCSGIVLWQLINLLDASNLCAPCLLIMFGNCSLVSLAFYKKPDSVLDLKVWTGRRAVAVGSLLLAVSGLVYAHGALNRPNAKQVAALKQSRRAHLIGLTVPQLGIKDQDAPHEACVLMFGLKTCEPCQQARLAMLTQTTIPVQIFELVRPEDSGTGWDRPTVPYSSDLFPTTPAFVVINKKGVVVDQFFGWSSDPKWEMAVTQSAKRDLDREAHLATDK